MYLKNISVETIIGVFDWERQAKQALSLDVVLYLDLSCPSLSDQLEHTVDYAEVEKKILTFADNSRFQLIERFAQAICDLCFGFEPVRGVKVRVKKPTALPSGSYAAVSLYRKKSKIELNKNLQKTLPSRTL